MRTELSGDLVSKTIATLGQDSLLSIVSNLKDLILEHGMIRLVHTGERLCTHDDPLPELVFPLSQNLRLVRESKLLGYLQKKRALCLGEILLGAPAPYTAEAEFETIVLSLPVLRFKEHIAQFPQELHYLKLMTKSEAARNLKRFLNERNISPREQIQILQAVSSSPTELKRGQPLLLDGSCLHLIERGEVAIERLLPSGHTVPLTLGAGAWLGGEALVPPHHTSYDAKASQDCVTREVSLPKAMPFLHRHNLIEALYDEPWIPHLAADLRSKSQENPIPPQGRAGETASFSTRDQTFRTGQSPLEALIASVENLGILRGFTVSSSSILSELSRHQTITPLRIAEAIERFGLIAMNIKCSLADLRLQSLPALAFVEDHFAVLLEIQKDSFVLLDPRQGLWIQTESEFRSSWNGSLLDIRSSPIDELPEAREKLIDKLPRPNRNALSSHRHARFNLPLFQALAQPLKEISSFFWNEVGLMILTFVIGLMIPWLSSQMVDSAFELRSLNPVIILCSGVLFFQVMSAVFSSISGFLRAHSTIRFENRVNALFYRQSLRALAKGDLKGALREMQMRFGELSHITCFLSDIRPAVICHLLALIVYSTILLYYDWRLTGIAFLSFPMLVGVSLLYRQRFYDNYDRSFEQTKHLAGIANDQLNAIAIIKSFGAEHSSRKKWEEAFITVLKTQRAISLESAAVGGAVGFLSTLIHVGILYLSYQLAASREISPGTLFAIQAYVGCVLASINGLAGLFNQVERLRIAQSKVAEVFEIALEESPRKARASVSVNLRGKIRLERLGFQYAEDLPWTLIDIDLTIYPSQRVAIVGRSGCGKTTLAKILSGLLSPTTGRIYYDDFQSDNLSRSCLRKQVGIILQNSELFGGSLRDNIALGDDAPDERRISKAAFLAGAESFIRDMPGGYDYSLAEAGIGLSGGQKQRIAIARALYLDPKILILDEATSALDAESESLVQERMRELTDGRTSIIIAHRLSTIRTADRIIVMNDGRIVEDGTHQSLISSHGLYSELFREQVLAPNEIGMAA
ncbi:MAG: ATP-binding cassette domain-containing protein [Deltaproteobacteria bacterium]|nr:ATP-binding cassette domain-containing protein [Deltaproteobacteria bacterium]